MPRPLAIAIATLFCLIAGGYLGYSQGRLDGRNEIIEIRLKPGVDDMALLGTRAEVLEILLENDPLERARRLAPKLQSLGPESLPQVLDAYDAVFFEIGDFEFDMLASWWARFDPRAAVGYTRIYWEAEEPNVVRAAIRQWASEAPEEALDYAVVNSDPSGYFPYINAVVSGWDESGRPGLEEYVRGLGPGYQRQRAMMQIVQRRVRRDGIEDTIEWAEALPSGKRAKYKLNAFRRVGRAVAELDPEAAARFTEKHLDTAYGRSVPSWVAKKWVQSDPQAAMVWLSSLPAGDNRDSAVEDAYRAWARRDPTASMAWADQQPIDSEWFQPALSVYARQMGPIDIGRSIALAGEVHHPDYRLITMGRIVRAWIVRDNTAAMAWLEQSDLPESDKKKITALPSLRELIESAQK